MLAKILYGQILSTCPASSLGACSPIRGLPAPRPHYKEPAPADWMHRLTTCGTPWLLLSLQEPHLQAASCPCMVHCSRYLLLLLTCRDPSAVVAAWAGAPIGSGLSVGGLPFCRASTPSTVT